MRIERTMVGVLCGGAAGATSGAIIAAVMGVQVVAGPVPIACCITGAVIGFVWGASSKE